MHCHVWPIECTDCYTNSPTYIKPPYCGKVPTLTDPGLGHVTCFGQRHLANVT